jgi:hypothetical protein
MHTTQCVKDALAVFLTLALPSCLYIVNMWEYIYLYDYISSIYAFTGQEPDDYDSYSNKSPTIAAAPTVSLQATSATTTPPDQNADTDRIATILNPVQLYPSTSSSSAGPSARLPGAEGEAPKKKNGR